MTLHPQPDLIFETRSESRSKSDAAPELLYDSFGMNPRLLRFFLLEKGLNVPSQEIDILAAENRKPTFLAINPAGQTPAVQLADGTIISEVPVICELIEELHPEPSLIGRTPRERAITRMWWRRVELNICVPMVHAFYGAEGLALFESRFRCLPEAAEGLKARARDGMRWIDGLLDQEWLAGDRFTVADICLYCYVDQLADAGQPMPEECDRLRAWFERVGRRPAAEDSIWKDRPMGMRG